MYLGDLENLPFYFLKDVPPAYTKQNTVFCSVNLSSAPSSLREQLTSNVPYR